MIDYFFRIFFGWVEVIVQGIHGEEIISQLALSGLRVWQVRKDGNSVRFVVSLRAVLRLRMAARQLGGRVHFGRRGGMPFKIHQIRTRPFLGVGAVTALLMILFVTGRIWVVDAPSPLISARERQTLVAAAAQAGLRPGTVRSRMNLSKERQVMHRLLPQYAFIGLSVHGILATIHVVPLVIRPPSPLVSKVVASHAGTLTSVLVFMGDPEVAPGEVVRKGQTLISGAVSAPVPLQPDGEGSTVMDAVKTPAKGDVYADVRYEQTVDQRLRFERWETTAASYSQQFVKFGDEPPVLLKGYGTIPFRHYRSQKFVTQLKWRDVNLPVEHVKIVYNEVQRRSVTLSRKQALAVASAEAIRRMRHAVHEGVRVRERRTIRWTSRGVTVQLVWTVNQNIAVPQGSGTRATDTKGDAFATFSVGNNGQ